MEYRKAGFVGLLFFSGLVVGLLFSPLVKPDSGQTESVEPNMTVDSANGSAMAELEALRGEIAARDEENERLRAEIQRLQKQTDTPAQSEPTPTLSEEERQAHFNQQWAERVERRLTDRVARMAQQYGLTPAQQDALKAVYLKRFENQRARRSGATIEPFDMDAALSGILTEQQFATYLDETQEDIYNRAELIATTQTLRLSQVMNLPAETENLIYETLNLTTQEMLIAQEEGETYNLRAVIQERLGSFLTEEQLQVVNETIRGPGSGWMRGGGRP